MTKSFSDAHNINHRIQHRMVVSCDTHQKDSTDGLKFNYLGLQITISITMLCAQIGSILTSKLVTLTSLPNINVIVPVPLFTGLKISHYEILNSNTLIPSSSTTSNIPSYKGTLKTPNPYLMSHEH